MSELPQLDAAEVAAQFDLGTSKADAVRATSGWGGHNVLWRVDTERGSFAVKQMDRPVQLDPQDSFAIENAAFDGGVPAARPVASRAGNCFERVDGAFVRCHAWVEGSAKSNEEATADDAMSMGRLVARLHALQIPSNQPAASDVDIDVERWAALATAAESRSAPWAGLLDSALGRLAPLKATLTAIALDDFVGSHRDLNAHNVLFRGEDLVLIDWDAAGPASVRAEAATYAVLWAQTTRGYDIEKCVAYLRGHRDEGGMVDVDDADTLSTWLGGLHWWTEQNVRMALDNPTDHQDGLTNQLLIDFLRGPELVAERQELLRAALARV